FFAREGAYFRTHPALNARLFLSVGADEEKDRMVATVDRLARILGERHYAGLIMSTHVFDGEDHLSVGPAAVSRSMRFLYSPVAMTSMGGQVADRQNPDTGQSEAELRMAENARRRAILQNDAHALDTLLAQEFTSIGSL